MLYEIPAVKQDGTGAKKRWFRDDQFDLYLWEGASGVTSMQLCYNRTHDEHVLSWSREAGYSHDRIDAPEDKPGRAMTALFRANGVFPAELVLPAFTAAAAEMPLSVAQFVVEKIAGCPLADGHPGPSARR